MRPPTMNLPSSVPNHKLDSWTHTKEVEIPQFDNDRRISQKESDESIFHNAPQLANVPPVVQQMSPNGSSRSYLFFCWGYLKKMQFKAIKIAQLLCVVYVFIITFSKRSLHDPQTGYIIDPNSYERTQQGIVLTRGTTRAVVAVSTFQLMCLALARLSAFFMYPTLAMVYLTKLRATASFLASTPVAIFMYTDMHAVHVYCGWTILICAVVHSVFHIGRWIAQNNLNLMIDHYSGVSGIVICSSLLLICLPMIYCTQRIRYEIRKNLHYFFVLFALALCFHTSPSAIPNGGFTSWVFSILLSLYILDNAVVHFLMTEKIETSGFRLLPSGVQLTMTVSDRFQKIETQGGYCYICLPWISKHEWHAFSVFENLSNPTERQIFILKAGDWTRKVHANILKRNTVRPVWLQGPFPGPYSSNADAYDNQILVASGIGITPALSVIHAFKSSRCINLIWTVREKDILIFYLKHLCMDRDGWNLIFYTGKGKLVPGNCQTIVFRNVCIIQGRPNFASLIPNVIYGVESGWVNAKNNFTKQDDRRWELEALSDLRTSLDDSNPDCFETSLSATEWESTLEFSIQGVQNDSELLDRIESKEPFQPWLPNEKARSFVLGLDRELVLDTWGVLYCGGSKCIESSLRELTSKYQIACHSESFAW